MTPQDLENIERQYDKARNAGPQAVADWAAQHAVTLFAGVRLGFDAPIASDDERCNAPAFTFHDDPIGPLRRLYPGVDGEEVTLATLAAEEITNRRNVQRGGDASYSGRLCDALRPFAALGTPVCLTALEEHRRLNDLPEGLPAFAVPDMSGEQYALAGVTVEQLKTAHDLINEIDGGGGA